MDVEHRAYPRDAGFERIAGLVEGMTSGNLGDLEAHARDFAERTGFTFTVLRPGTEEVIGCLYIYPAKDGEHDAHVRSWVRADVAELDAPLYGAVSLARGTLAVRARALRQPGRRATVTRAQGADLWCG